EQITDITDSVRKGQSWHAYQEYKKHKEQLEKLSIELDTAKQRELTEPQLRVLNQCCQANEQRSLHPYRDDGCGCWTKYDSPT
ncbi:hypothetical protein ACSLNT_29330, partial [Escherichia coli]